MENSFQITYVVDYIIFRSEETKFTIFCAKKVRFEDKTIDKNPLAYIIKGFFPRISAGDSFESTCSWVYDKNYGHQLSAEFSSIIYPQSVNGILRFLEKNAHGLGRNLARIIVDKFGVSSLDVIRNDYQSLTSIPGIGKKKAEKIHDSILEHESLERLSIYLFGKGITNYNEIVKIYEKLGNEALDKIIANPYSICDFISASKMPVADKIALASGYELTSIVRIERIILYYLWVSSYNGGNCYSSLDELTKNLPQFLEKQHIESFPVSEELLGKTVESLAKNRKVQLTKYKGNTIIYLTYLFNIETETASLIKKMNEKTGGKYSKEYFDKFFKDYTKKTGITPEAHQKKAVINAIENKFSIITGGAGTGKTQTVNTIISAIYYEDKKAKVLLCSPTGRAAKRMCELTGQDAYTIHRALGINGEADLDGEPADIDADYIICDEASMIDAVLFRKLLASVERSNASFVLVGDKDQLPPVGVGLPFKDLVESGCVPTTRLQYLFRQDECGQINKNANLILEGANGSTKSLSFDVDKQDFFFFPSNTPEKCHDYITRSIDSLISLGTKPEDIVILSPMKKTEYGVISINNLVQNHLNPQDGHKKEYSAYPYTLREGDRVMQTTNNYELDVFNGDVGVIKMIDTEKEEIIVQFEEYTFIDGRAELSDRQIIYSYSEASELILAYAVTVHKSQGSEYPCVLMPISNELINVSRNILYTAVTRAKQRFVFIGSSEALYQGISRTEIMHRHTLLKERLILDKHREGIR